MILRKPYAFLIQYFQRIHLVLLGLCFYIFYKTSTLRTFVSEFIRTESYNADLEPIKNYIGFLPIIVILLCLGIFLILMILLRHKKKPWKIYLVPFFSYIFLLGVMLYIRNFFVTYNDISDITKIMAGRDLLLIAYLLQFAVFLLLILRTLGIDLNKFGFKNDQEYLEIKEEDREEFELSLQFDKDRVRRTVNKLFRNIGYVYQEHRFILNTLMTVLAVILVGYTYYYFGILHKIYKENQSFKSNFYEVTVLDSYLTNRKDNGDLIEKNSKYSYVIVKLKVKNLAGERNMYTDRFHLINRSNEAERTPQYQTYFSTYGKVYDNSSFDYNETKVFNLIYRVDKDWKSKYYTLYYQGLDKSFLLRKVKLKVKDYQTPVKTSTKKLNQDMKIEDKDFTFINYQVSDSAIYNSYKCFGTGCGISPSTVTSYNKAILKIDYISEYFEPKTFVDFSTKYAKIKYEDKDGKTSSIDCVNAVSKDYTDNSLYLKVPLAVKEANKIDLVYTVNGSKYTYHVK